jgi:hypothetical protein
MHPDIGWALAEARRRTCKTKPSTGGSVVWPSATRWPGDP